MKRKTFWLALPLMLFVLMLAVKWRADNPTPTKADLEIRALMLNSDRIGVKYVPDYFQRDKDIKVRLSAKEFKPMAECFHITPQSVSTNGLRKGVNGNIQVVCALDKPRADGVNGVYVTIGLDGGQGIAVLSRREKSVEPYLHPVTIKRWVDILLADPRLNPELRTPKTL